MTRIFCGLCILRTAQVRNQPKESVLNKRAVDIKFTATDNWTLLTSLTNDSSIT